MPNWCTTQYVLVSRDKESIDEISTIMQEIESGKRESLENGFGNSWLGNLVHALGADWTKVYCRGWFYQLSSGEDFRKLGHKGEYYLAFDTEHAWSRPFEVEDLIKEKYPEIDIYFFEEELGMGIFQTNDEDGSYFGSRYLIDIEETGEYEYYDKEEDALKPLIAYFKRDFSSWEEAEAFAEDHNDKNWESKTDDCNVYIKRAEIVK